MQQKQESDFDRFLEQVLADTDTFQLLMKSLSINVTAMFRDPWAYRYIREELVPVLRTYPHIRIWSAGCSTGAEPWSLAMMMHEEGLLDRTLIYATDFNPVAVRQAALGVFPLEEMAQYTRNYIDAGGTSAFSNYYTASRHLVHLDQNLKRNMVFSTHNLATDQSFNEFHLILCRNVLIYFDDILTSRVLQLCYDSLADRGFLVLGLKEYMRFYRIGKYFDPLNEDNKVFRKI